MMSFDNLSRGGWSKVAFDLPYKTEMKTFTEDKFMACIMKELCIIGVYHPDGEGYVYFEGFDIAGESCGEFYMTKMEYKHYLDHGPEMKWVEDEIFDLVTNAIHNYNRM